MCVCVSRHILQSLRTSRYHQSLTHLSLRTSMLFIFTIRSDARKIPQNPLGPSENFDVSEYAPHRTPKCFRLKQMLKLLASCYLGLHFTFFWPIC